MTTFDILIIVLALPTIIFIWLASAGAAFAVIEKLLVGSARRVDVYHHVAQRPQPQPPAYRIVPNNPGEYAALHREADRLDATVHADRDGYHLVQNDGRR